MKLKETLKLLPIKEYSAFRSFLNTFIFNKRKDVIKLFELYISKEEEKKSPQELYALLYPGTKFSATNWRLVNSRLLKLLEDYFAHKSFAKSEVKKKLLLSQFYRSHNRTNVFQNSLNDAHRFSQKQQFRNTEYLYEQFTIEEQRYDYIQSQNRKVRTNLQKVSDHLDNFFIASKLRQACQQLSRKTINQEEYHIEWLDEILTQLQDHSNQLEQPAIAMYYYAYKALCESGTENDFKQFLNSIETYSHFLPAAELRDIYLLAINYGIKTINLGIKTYQAQTFDLYTTSLDNGFLLQDGIMPESTYSNIVSLAIGLKKYRWAEEFINKFKTKLPYQFRQPLYHFCLAKLYYDLNNLSQSLQNLVQVATKAPFLYLGAKTLQIKCYYELSEWDALNSSLDSLRVYLQRHKDLGYRKTNYDNLINFMRTLLNWKMMSKTEKEKTRQAVLAAELFTERDWFLEQMK